MAAHILRGIVIGAGPIAKVRRLDGGLLNLATPKQYKYGTNIVMMYDASRNFVLDSFTVSEWEALQADVNLDDAPGKEEEIYDPDFICIPEDEDEGLGGFSSTDF